MLIAHFLWIRLYLDCQMDNEKKSELTLETKSCHDTTFVFTGGTEVVMTTLGAISYCKVGIMTTLCVQSKFTTLSIDPP